MSSTRGTSILDLAVAYCRPGSLGQGDGPNVKLSNVPGEEPKGGGDGAEPDPEVVATVVLQAIDGTLNAIVGIAEHEDSPEIVYKRARDRWGKAMQGLRRTMREYRAVEDKIQEARQAKRPGWKAANRHRRWRLEQIRSKTRGILDINSPGLPNTGNIEGWRRLVQKNGDVLFGFDANRDLFNLAYIMGIGQPLEPMPTEIFARGNLKATFPNGTDRSHREGFPPLYVRQRSLSQMVNMYVSGLLPGEIRPPLWLYGLDREDRAEAGIGPTIAQVTAALDAGEQVVLAGPPTMDYRTVGGCVAVGAVVPPMPTDPDSETIGDFQRRIAAEIIRAAQAADDRWLLGKAQRVFAAPAWRGDDRSRAKKHEMLTALTLEGSDVYVDPAKHSELGSIIQGEFARLELNPPANWTRKLTRGIQKAGDVIKEGGQKVVKTVKKTASKWPWALAAGGVAGGVYLAGPDKLLRWLRGGK